jgi:hypothetical protein
LFTGPKLGAQPGPYTNTAGYISNAELNLIIANTSIAKTQYVDAASDSNILVWGDNWAAYIDDSNKITRTLLYSALSFGGTADWAIDLEASLTVLDIPPLTVDQTGPSDTQEICHIDFTTPNYQSLAVACSVSNATWSASGAKGWLDQFLKGQQNLTSWTLAFFEDTVANGSMPGGSTFDCGNLADDTCGSPNACMTYKPPEAFFVHQQISQLFSIYRTIVTDIINNLPAELGNTTGNISHNFARPGTTSAQLLSIPRGILSTATAVGTFLSDAGPLDSLGVFADALGAISSCAQLEWFWGRSDSEAGIHLWISKRISLAQ